MGTSKGKYVCRTDVRKYGDFKNSKFHSKLRQGESWKGKN